MINVSGEFREVMARRRDFRCFAQMTLADGSEYALDGKDFAIAGNGYTDGAGASGLPLGAAVCRQIRLQLVNDDERWAGRDLYGARLRLWLTLELSETAERIQLGTFTAVEPASYGETVTVSAWDDMYRTDRAYETALAFPATLGSMYREICERCAIPYGTAAFPNEDYMVQAPPAGETTCRQALGYIAMLAGGNARIDRTGRMQILPYALGEEAALELEEWSSLETGTDDILVTGLSMAVEDGDGTEQTVLYGEEGYVLQVENPLVTPGQEQASLALMGAGLVGYPFRPFSGEHTAFPLAEFMDMALVRDRRGRAYKTVLTDVDFAFGGYTSFSNSAEPAARNGSRYVSPEARARLAARRLVERERTAREAEMERLAGLLSQSGGLFCTVQTLEDDSKVYYLHNRPELADSATVMKLTAEAIGFSTDGGKTWPYGFAVTGEMVMGVIRSEGLSADWVKFGTLPQERVDGLAELSSGLEVLRERIQSTVTTEQLDERNASLTQQMTSFMQDRESVILQAMEEYAASADLDALRETINAQLKVLTEQVSIEFARVTAEQRQADEQLSGQYEQITRYFRFTPDGLEIGENTSPLLLRLTNDRISFLYNGQEVAYISDRMLYITDAHALNSLRIGGFSWTPRQTGSLSLVKVE